MYVAGLEQINSIDLENNALTGLQWQVFPPEQFTVPGKHKTLRYVNLRANPLECSRGLCWLEEYNLLEQQQQQLESPLSSCFYGKGSIICDHSSKHEIAVHHSLNDEGKIRLCIYTPYNFLNFILLRCDTGT